MKHFDPKAQLEQVGNNLDKFETVITDTISWLELSKDELLDGINIINREIANNKDITPETLADLQKTIEDAKTTLKNTPMLLANYEKILKSVQEKRKELFLKYH